LIYQVQPDVPDPLIGDAGRLRQVLLNLAGNAVKFTDEGEVVVRVEIQGGGPAPSPGAGEVGLRFTVRDTGIGIPPDQQARIFRAFEQEDTSTTRKDGGTGLSLTIASAASQPAWMTSRPSRSVPPTCWQPSTGSSQLIRPANPAGWTRSTRRCCWPPAGTT